MITALLIIPTGYYGFEGSYLHWLGCEGRVWVDTAELNEPSEKVLKHTPKGGHRKRWMSKAVPRRYVIRALLLRGKRAPKRVSEVDCSDAPLCFRTNQFTFPKGLG
jgi:hypothetical protein